MCLIMFGAPRKGPCARSLVLTAGEIGPNLRFATRGRRMFVTFFTELKAAGVPVTLREYLTLMEAMQLDLGSRRDLGVCYVTPAKPGEREPQLSPLQPLDGDGGQGRERAAGAR